MSFTLKPVALAFAASACLCAMGAVQAQETTQCTIDPTDPNVDTTIAVASNFFEPAQDMLADFLAATYPPPATEPVIRICHDATGQINRDIRGTGGATPPGVIGQYSLFLAANASTPDALVGTVYVPVGASSFLYAKGIPTLIGQFNPSNPGNKISNVTELMPSLSPSTARSHDVTGTVTSANAISITNAASVAIANHADAPYGLAAVNILKDMALWDYTTQPIPAWVRNPLFANIGLTLDAVNDETTKTGFVSKAQVCGALADYTYIEFTGYLLDQKGILINSGDATQNALAASIKNFMMSNANPTYWSGFLTAHCYK